MCLAYHISNGNHSSSKPLGERAQSLKLRLGFRRIYLGQYGIVCTDLKFEMVTRSFNMVFVLDIWLICFFIMHTYIYIYIYDMPFGYHYYFKLLEQERIDS